MKRRHPRAFALVITLALIVLLAILVTGFVMQARLETFSAKSHADGVRASLYAQAGVDTALSRIQNAPATGTNAWLSGPGRILALSSGTTGTAIDLSSGAMAANASADEAADLNIARLADPSHGLLMGRVAPMRVAWIYVRQDGSLDLNTPPAANPGNPVIGRYAFWVDDETAKINVNTAWIKAAVNPNFSATNPASHPSLVDLTALGLSAADATAVRSYRTANHFFNTPDEVAQVSPAWKAQVEQNREAFTHYNLSSEMNMFGEPKIMLTTSTSLAGGTNCIDILKTQGADPGLFTSLDETKVLNVYRRLYQLLSRTDWPVLPGQSLAQKYAPMDVHTLCLNIIDYVRSAESTNSLVEPLRLNIFPIKLDYQTGIFGNSRRVVFTELGAFVSATPTAGNWIVNARVRIHLPADSGLASVDLTTLQLLINITGGGSALPHNSETKILASEIVAGGAILNAGEYRTIARTFTISATTTPVRPKSLTFQIALANPANPGAAKRYDVMQVSIYPVDAAGVAEASITSLGLDDPVLRLATDWTPGPNKFDSLTDRHHTALGGTPLAVSPQQDTDASGHLTNIGMHLPAPKGSAANPTGQVRSVGELGFIHAGMAVSGTGVPWRTLRLQPQKSGATTLPDWVLTDLFSVPLQPTTAEKDYVQPAAGTVGGRVNINAALRPFADGTDPLYERLAPVAAALLNTGNPLVSTNQAQTMAGNISRITLANNQGNAGRVFGNTNFFYAPGQMAEISGVADGGEATEAVIRGAIGLTTVRGSVFSVFGVGQALKEDRTGRLHILAEKRQEKIFERTSAGELIPVFSRELTP